MVEIINPENEQHLIDAYVPVVIAEVCKNEVHLVETSSFHRWTSDITRMITNINDKIDEERTEEDIASLLEEEVKEWNDTHSYCPISVDDIECNDGSCSLARDIRAYYVAEN